MGLRSNPTYRQRRFGAEIRRLRERGGLSVLQASTLMGMKPPHLSNIEAGRTSLSPERLRTLAARVPDTDDTYVEALIDLGHDSGKGWWSEYRNRLPPSRMDLAELEAGARTIVSYEPMFVPGLLQTPAYATAIYRGGYTGAPVEEQDRDIEFRLRRRSVLTGERAPRFHAVIHEAALHASLGDRDVMRGQLLRLIEDSRLPNVTIQILPFDGPVAFGTPFVLTRPAVPELSTVVVAHIERSLYLGDTDSVTKYNTWFAGLAAVALPPLDATVPSDAHLAKDSLGLIQRLLYPLL